MFLFCFFWRTRHTTSTPTYSYLLLPTPTTNYVLCCFELRGSLTSARTAYGPKAPEQSTPASR